jgi:hypothetical protein
LASHRRHGGDGGPPNLHIRWIANERDGSVASETREAPRGSEQSFASAEEIIAKFRKLTRAAITKPQRDTLVDAVLTVMRVEQRMAQGRRIATCVDRAALVRKNGGSDGARTHDLRRDRPTLPQKAE